MRDFSQRSGERELMDEENISYTEFHDCLQGLETINHLTLAYRPTLRWLRRWRAANVPLRILDAGSGGGDMLRQVAKYFAATGSEKQNLELIGVDLNPWSKKSAEQHPRSSAIEHHTANIFHFEPERNIDLVICSLFTHHLNDAQLVDFLRWIDRRAEKGWFINDLHRHAVPYYFIKAATALFSRNRLIRNDAAVSVARAFSVADWQSLLERAGIGERASIRWYFPFRLCIACDKRG